jgi:DNA-binding MarR family transcriptional regulator
LFEELRDFDLVREIGFHQEQGKPLTMKQIYLLDLASVATVQRRLSRLRHLGVVVPRRSQSDARAVELTISPKPLKALAGYAELLGIKEAGIDT